MSNYLPSRLLNCLPNRMTHPTPPPWTAWWWWSQPSWSSMCPAVVVVVPAVVMVVGAIVVVIVVIGAETDSETIRLADEQVVWPMNRSFGR